jgi:hypothetical protein
MRIWLLVELLDGLQHAGPHRALDAARSFNTGDTVAVDTRARRATGSHHATRAPRAGKPVDRVAPNAS